MRSRIGLILLAAGASTRLEKEGQGMKQLLVYQGKTLLRRATETACASSCAPCVVVLGANATRLTEEIADLPVQICVNTNWQEGMGTSLKYGAEALPPSLTGVSVMLCDQPLLTTEHLERLVQRHREYQDKIIASDYGERLGVPCLFPAAFFPELLQLSGDEGARQMLRRHTEAVQRVPFPEGAWDVDTVADWQRLGN